MTAPSTRMRVSAGLALGLLLAVPLVLSAPGCAGKRSLRILSTCVVPLDGSPSDPIALPDVDAARYRLVVSGVFACSADGRERDAFYAIAREGEAATEHGLLRLTPSALTLVDSDIARHRYTYQVPGTAEPSVAPWSVALDTNKLAADVGVRPEELPGLLSGELQAELIDPRPAPVSTRQALERYWPCWVCLGPLCLLVVLVSLVTVLQSRRDVSRRLARVDRASRSAKQAADGLGREGAALADAVEALRKAAYRTVAFIEQTRLAESGQTEAALAKEAAQLESREAAARTGAQRQAAAEGLDANRAARAALGTLTARREDAFRRLDEAEALLRTAAGLSEPGEVGAVAARVRALTEHLEREYPLPGIGESGTTDRDSGRRFPPDGETPIDS
jgi:hypothetical protein